MSSKTILKLLDMYGDMPRYGKVLYESPWVNVDKDYCSTTVIVEYDEQNVVDMEEEADLEKGELIAGTYKIYTVRSGGHNTDYDYDHKVTKVETYTVLESVLKWKEIKEEE